MKMWEMLQAAYDFWRPNKYGIKPYLCKDGRKHPVAIICPGGAYSMVCSFVEGMPIAKALNKCGYHAVVAYYRTKKKARFKSSRGFETGDYRYFFSRGGLESRD